MKKGRGKERKNTFKFIFCMLARYKSKIILNSLFSLVLMGIYMISPIIEQQIVDKGLISKNFSYLIELVMISACLSIVAYIVEYTQMHIQAGVAASLRNNLKIGTLKHALKLKLVYLKKHSLLALMTDANTDINNLSRICSNDIFGIFIEFITVLGYLIGLLLLDWKLTIVVLCLIPIKVFISSITGTLSKKKMEELLEIQKKISRWQSDNYSGISEIKNWNLYDHIENEFGVLSTNREKLDRQMYIYNALDTFLKKSSEKIVFVIVYLLGAVQIWRNELSLGTFIAFIEFSGYLLTPVDVLSSLKIVLGNITPSIKSYNEFMRLEEEDYKEKNNSIAVPNEIKFENVSFAYDDKKIFDNLNLTLKKGEKTAIVGLNGSGKSTLINLLLRYYSPIKGKILFDNTNIEEFSLDKYRNQFSMMGQNVFLFNTTILNNITMFGDIKDIDYSNDILDYVKELPDKENTIVGFNGTNLSGGEKQRVALARSLMKDAGILILDEATSNCDVAIEDVYKKILGEIKRNYIICISHNYELIKNFDRIILLQDGAIVGDGDFETLKYQLQGMEELHIRKKLKRRGDTNDVNYI